MDMSNTKFEWVTFIIVLVFVVSVNSRNCKKQMDCSNFECCVTSNLEYNAIGKCQNLRKEGSSCSGLAYLLPIYGGKYFSSCPCEKGLICKDTFNIKIKMIYSTCVNDTLNFLSKTNPGINHKYKREIDQILKDLRHYDTEYHYNSDDNGEEIPLQLDTLPEDNTESSDTLDSESPLTDTESDESLKVLWDSENPEQYIDKKNEEPMPVEDDKQSEPIHHILPVDTTAEKVMKVNDLGENLKNLIQGVLSSIKKPPTENSLVHDEVEESSDLEGHTMDASLSENDEKSMDYSQTDVPDEIEWKGTTAESVTTPNYAYLLKFIQDMIGSKNKPSPKGNFGADENEKSSHKDNELNNYHQEIHFSPTKSPIELEWDKATIESVIHENPTKQPIERKQVEEMSSHIVRNKNPEKESDSMVTAGDGIAINKHDIHPESPHHGESLIKVNYSNNEHEKHIDHDTHDPNADYMDEF